MTSQQMFPEEEQPQETNEIYHVQQPYSRSTSGMPKEEPAASYEEPLSSYSSQDYQSGYSAQQQQEFQSQYRDTHMYGTNNERQQFRTQQWGVPYWARPQVHRRRSWGGILVFIILAALLFKPLLALLGLVIILPIALMVLALMIPFALVFVVALPYLLFSMFTGRSFSRHRPRRWRYTRGLRYGPWRW